MARRFRRAASFTIATGAAVLATAAGLRGDIESNFDDLVYPGDAGAGWVAGWQQAAGLTIGVDTASPIDAPTPYLAVTSSGTGARNIARAYLTDGGVDVTQPHQISFKFRLNEDPAAFESTFTAFNDRLHIFGRNGLRLTAGTDSTTAWSIFAAGAAHASGAYAGRTFWIYDNVTGNGSSVIIENAVDTGITLAPQHVYSITVRLDPPNRIFAVHLADETAVQQFTSLAPHRFRELAAPVGAHTNLHVGTQCSAADDARGFDLDSVRIAPAAGLVLPPEIVNVTPVNHAFHDAQKGIHFEVRSAAPLAPPGITLTLNGADVTADLAIVSSATNHLVAYNKLQPDRSYTAVITAQNVSGPVSWTFEFNTATGEVLLFDSGGFESEAVYPLGNLQAITHDGGTWLPSAVPAQIVDLADGQHAKVFHREQMGTDNSDYLEVAPVAAGILTLAFDARVSTATGRTLDIGMQPVGSASQASFIGFGINPGKLAFYDGSAWVSIMDLDTQWHHYEMINYLSGPRGATFDLEVDGQVVGRNLIWRSTFAAGTGFGRFRFGAIRGTAGTYGELDNLRVTASQENLPPPVIANIVPAHRAHFHPAANGMQFEVTSEGAIDPAGITMQLNGQDVSGQLVVAGEPLARQVSFPGLQPNQVYTAEITASNAFGIGTATVQFNTIRQKTTVVDSHGFADNTIYPLGPLGNVTDGLAVWTAGRLGDPSQIVDSGVAPYGKALQRAQTGVSSQDIMDFTPFNSGILTIAFDARASTAFSPTLLLSVNRTGQETQASSLGWGVIPGKIARLRASTWYEIADLDESWHHYEIINYLDGPKSHTFDLVMDGTVRGEGLLWAQGISAGEYLGRLRIAADQGVPGDFAQIDNLQASLTPLPPAIANLVPANQTSFHTASQGVSFHVVSVADTAASDIHLILNGADVSSALEISGDPTNRLAVYRGLEPNAFYEGEIRAQNVLGLVSQTLEFNTLYPTGALSVEVEDYNLGSGQYINDPPPSGLTPGGAVINPDGNGYFDRAGTSGVDFSIAVPSAGDPQQAYRFFDPTTTRYTLDGLRSKYVSSGAPDYDVWQWSPTDWLNYTRTFAAGPYQVFLRASTPAAAQVCLQSVTSDPTQPGQSVSALGRFNLAARAGYQHAELKDDLGQSKVLSLDGPATFRLAACGITADLALNYLVFAQVPPPPEEIQIDDPLLDGAGFHFQFPTRSGAQYVVEYNTQLAPTGWTTLDTVSGTGNPHHATDSNPADTIRFYRVRRSQ